MFFFFKQKTAYEMRISDWSSDVCSSDLGTGQEARHEPPCRCLCQAGRSGILNTTSTNAGSLLPSRVDGEFGTPEGSDEHTAELQSLMRISYAVFSLKENIMISTPLTPGMCR